jgi:hypothetical protein
MIQKFIKHHQYGKGSVKEVLHKGLDLYVEFRDGFRWVRCDEVEELGISPTQFMSEENFKFRRMVEAFGLGIVPLDCIEEFMLGRDREISQLKEWLCNSANNVLILKGDYGSGKTHILNYAYWQALQEGFAVSRIEMDPSENPFNKPKRVYSHLVDRFLYRSKKTQRLNNFENFLQEIMPTGIFKNHPYFGYLHGKLNEESIWEWVKAREAAGRPLNTNLPPLYDYATAANIYCYLISSIGYATSSLGLKGWMLIFDEGESVEMYGTSYQGAKNRNFLEALIRTVQNEEKLTKAPSSSGLDYCNVGNAYEVPFLYKTPSYLKLFIAFTPTVN